MYFNDGSKSLRNLCLPVVLLLLPALLQAESVKATDANTANTGQQPGSEAGRSYPQRTQRHQVKKEIIPPPPPGPYMSSALSDYSVKGPSFGHNFNKPVYRHDPSFVPMDMFSPDIPWPNNLRGNNTNRWMPESGYRYAPSQPMTHMAPPRAKRQQAPANAGQRQVMGNYTGRQHPGGYMPNAYNAPAMNMNGSRWTPSMGYTPAGPHYNGPSYRPNSSNNKIARPAQPPHRAQNPRYNQSGSN